MSFGSGPKAPLYLTCVQNESLGNESTLSYTGLFFFGRGSAK